MPFNELQRRESWPPTILRLNNDDLHIEEEDVRIEDNPFSYFLTSPDDADMITDDLSAGIESQSNSVAPIREISPSSLQRTRLEPVKDEDDIEEKYLLDLCDEPAIPISLKDYTAAYELHQQQQRKSTRLRHSTSSIADKSRLSSRRALSEMTTLGSRIARSGKGRGRTRSLSAQRPHAWREPSPDVWSIPEEDDSCKENEATDGITSTLEGASKDETAPPQAKKKVRFALP